jgi:hypothetical protein
LIFAGPVIRARTSEKSMTNTTTNEVQRAGIRRTALIVGGVACAIFVLFFVKQLFWH